MSSSVVVAGRSVFGRSQHPGAPRCVPVDLAPVVGMGVVDKLLELDDGLLLGHALVERVLDEPGVLIDVLRNGPRRLLARGRFLTRPKGGVFISYWS